MIPVWGVLRGVVRRSAAQNEQPYYKRRKSAKTALFAAEMKITFAKVPELSHGGHIETRRAAFRAVKSQKRRRARGLRRLSPSRKFTPAKFRKSLPVGVAARAPRWSMPPVPIVGRVRQNAVECVGVLAGVAVAVAVWSGQKKSPTRVAWGCVCVWEIQGYATAGKVAAAVARAARASSSSAGVAFTSSVTSIHAPARRS